MIPKRSRLPDLSTEAILPEWESRYGNKLAAASRPRVSGTAIERGVFPKASHVKEGRNFIGKQLASGLSGLAFFALAASSLTIPMPILRYDFLLIGCIAIQVALIAFKIESIRELSAVVVFHAVGVALEWYKVSRGAWSYPEEAGSKFFGVPLFAGFMYAAVASYMIQAHHRFDLKFANWPKTPVLIVMVAVVYGHYFGGSQVPGVRWMVLSLAALVFWRTQVEFTTTTRRSMPLVASLALIGTAIYGAENLCTALRVWEYPHQTEGWQPVNPTKLSAWMLLSAVSLILIHPFAQSDIGKPERIGHPFDSTGNQPETA